MANSRGFETEIGGAVGRGGFQLHNRKTDPCPICGDHSGKCKTSKDGNLHLCMVATADGDAPGWRFIGAADLWGQWVKPYDQSTNPAPSGRRIETKHKPIDPPLLVSDEARDRAYRAILDQLTLSESDRAELAGRGISDADIEAIGFKTWIANTTLTGDLPKGLPGLRGKTLAARSGYLIPVRDASGAILGLQIRPHDAGKIDKQDREIPRYAWVSTPDAPIGGDHQEWPLAVYRGGQASGNQPIGLAEGTAAKPFLSAQRSGYAVIGAAGGLWTKSPSRLKQTLDDLGTKPGDAITLFADAGSFSNKHVKRRYTELFKLLKSWELKLYVASWGQLNSKRKGDPKRGDFDEIAESTPWRSFNWEQPNDAEKLGGIGFLWDEFKRCVERDRYDELTAFTAANATVTTSGRYIPITTWEQLNKPGLILSRAVPDSGKSFAIIKSLIKNFLAEGKRVLSITTRRKLAAEQLAKFQGLVFLNDDDANINKQGICCCYESLYKLKGQQFDLILMDEVRLGLSILATSSTLKTNRATTRAVMEELFTKAILNGGTVIGLDADVDDRSMRYLAAICGLEKPTDLHHHDQLPVARNIYAVPFKTTQDGEKISGRSLVMGLFKAHVLKVCKQIQDGKSIGAIDDLPMLVSDSQAMIEDLATVSTKEIGEELSEFLNELEREIEEEFTDSPVKFSILRIDSKTSSEIPTVNYTTNPTNGKGNAIAVTISPSAFVGVSDEDDRIKTVYCVAHGVVGINLTRQALGRARRAQNWVVAYADSFSLSDGRPSRQTDPSKVLAEIQRKQPNENGWQAIAQQVEERFSGNVAEMLAFLNRCADPDSNLWRNVHTQFASEEWAISNFERANFGELLIERLVREGHRMLPIFESLPLAGIQPQTDEEFWEVIDELVSTRDKTDEAREARHQRESADLSHAAIESDMDASDARTILENDLVFDSNGKPKPATEEDRVEARAVLLRDRYPDLMAQPDETEGDGGSPQLVWSCPKLAQQFCLEWVIKDRDKQKQAYRHWVFKNPETAKRIAILHQADFIESAAKGRHPAAIDDRGIDRRPLIVSKLLRGIDLNVGTAIGAGDHGEVLARWKKIPARDRETLGCFLRKGPNARLEFFAQLLEIAGFKVSKEIKRKKSILIVEPDRFFAGAVEAIARAKAIELAELENPELKVARRDQERQARADRRAANAATANPVAVAAIAPVAERPATPTATPPTTTAAPAPVAASPALMAAAELLAKSLDGQIENHRNLAAKVVAAGNWAITISEDRSYRSGFRFEPIDRSGEYRQADVRWVESVVAEVREVLHRQPIGTVAEEPAPIQATGDSPIERANHLLSLWQQGAIAQAAATIRGWFREIDTQADPLGLSRLKTAVCGALPGLEVAWNHVLLNA